MYIYIWDNPTEVIKCYKPIVISCHIWDNL